jgi:hypothetical protein
MVMIIPVSADIFSLVKFLFVKIFCRRKFERNLPKKLGDLVLLRNLFKRNKFIVKKMTKFIFVTGGVSSSLGKGILTSSLGALLKARGYSVNIVKCDPYLNIDAGTMSPIEHGEVFVTQDGAETDLDLGNYERYLNIS